MALVECTLPDKGSVTMACFVSCGALAVCALGERSGAAASLVLHSQGRFRLARGGFMITHSVGEQPELHPLSSVGHAAFYLYHGTSRMYAVCRTRGCARVSVGRVVGMVVWGVGVSGSCVCLVVVLLLLQQLR
jgi:hypothetical protein